MHWHPLHSRYFCSELKILTQIFACQNVTYVSRPTWDAVSFVVCSLFPYLKRIPAPLHCYNMCSSATSMTPHTMLCVIDLIKCPPSGSPKSSIFLVPLLSSTSKEYILSLIPWNDRLWLPLLPFWLRFIHLGEGKGATWLFQVSSLCNPTLPLPASWQLLLTLLGPLFYSRGPLSGTEGFYLFSILPQTPLTNSRLLSAIDFHWKFRGNAG